MMLELELSFLGSFGVKVAGQPVTRFRSDKIRGLMAYLTVEADLFHERATLAELLWPEMPEDNARRNLTQSVIRLRRTIREKEATAPHFIITRQAIGFNPHSQYQLDVSEFVRLVNKGTLTDLERAIALYKGEFLMGFNLPRCVSFEEWLLLKREYLQRLALEALESLTAAHLEAGNFSQAQRYARRQLELDAWREIAHRQLMQALACCGHRNAALVQYGRCLNILQAELRVAPQAVTTALYRQIKTGQLDPGGLSQPSSPQVSPRYTHRHNIPSQLVPLIGRESVVAKLGRLLRGTKTRLVTLIGAGGVGKTSLALAVAEQLIKERANLFGDGVWFVPLHGIAVGPMKRAAITVAIGNALNFVLPAKGGGPRQLFDYLQHKKMLLILDSFEHLIDEASYLPELLHALPGITILVTSQVCLNLGPERVIWLDGLPMPELDEAPNLANLGTAAPVRLFVACARRTFGDFTLNETNANDVIQICRLVDGIPLGIELAAHWTGHFTCAEVAQAIEDNLDFLTISRHDLPERQQSMRAVFDYAWQFLSRTERRVLAQASVIRGSFSREAALAITGARITDLAALVDHSLLQQPCIGHYRMHGLLRQFAAEKLTQLKPEMKAIETNLAFG